MGKLQQLVTRLKQTPMNVGSLKKVLPEYATFKTIGQLTEHRSKVFGRFDCVVVLIPSNFSTIGHFVVLTRFPKYIEYFSSLGGSPKSETQKLGQRADILLRLLGKNYVYNSVALQSSSSTIQDCALFVLARVKLRKLKLREFQALFKGRISLQSPDDIVSLLAVLLVVDL
jgi:hypothetical protein